MATEQGKYPDGWQVRDFNPNDHMLSLKGKDYLTVQTRLQWFVKEQRALIAAGLATVPYIVRTDLVELDRERGFAHFVTYVRDVLGNEATMFGSETAKDFGDYIEKASTKSVGRALAMLGYSTGAAADLDEGEKPCDAPQESRRQTVASNGHGNGQQHRGEPINAADLKARAEALGIVGPKWGALYNRHKGNLAAISAELAQETSPRP